jgi:hypothetical protein
VKKREIKLMGDALMLFKSHLQARAQKLKQDAKTVEELR